MSKLIAKLPTKLQHRINLELYRHCTCGDCLERRAQQRARLAAPWPPVA